MSNPLLNGAKLPLFSQIKPEHIQVAVEQAIAQCRAQIDEVLQNLGPFTWDT